MITRVFFIAAVAMAVCACASTASDRDAQSSVYLVGDNAAVLKANTGPGNGTEGNFAVIKRIYWFFAGR